MSRFPELAVLEGIVRATAGDVPGVPAAPLAVAYSGGLDSRFLIHAIRLSGLNVRALHINGPHIPAHEHAYAAQWAYANNIPLEIISLNPFSLPVLRGNPEDRCYHCKKMIFTALREAAGPLPLCDGTNASDFGEYRPGLKALRELGIRSPLAEAGIDKRTIRELAAATGMENPTQAAQPCLLTRFPYGADISLPQLETVGKAEEAVRRVFTARGQPDRPFRVRYESAATFALHLTGETSPALLAALASALEECGLPAVPLRTMDTLSGYFDRA